VRSKLEELADRAYRLDFDELANLMGERLKQREALISTPLTREEADAIWRIMAQLAALKQQSGGAKLGENVLNAGLQVGGAVLSQVEPLASILSLLGAWLLLFGSIRDHHKEADRTIRFEALELQACRLLEHDVEKSD
jgi:hypothetical protein